jgi:hypothetical protein
VTIDPTDYLPILCLDFDGVCHKYSQGWRNGEIYDGPTEGFAAWATEAAKHFRLVIYSSRSKAPAGISAMKEWMSLNQIDQELFEFAHEKPAAFLTIDDRAITFTGDWGDYPMRWLKDFKTWNQKR